MMVDGRGPLRRRAFRLGGISSFAAPGGSDDHRRPRVAKMAPVIKQTPRADARTKMGNLDGRVRDLR